MSGTDTLQRTPPVPRPRLSNHFLHRSSPPGFCAIPLDGILLGRGERVFDEPFEDPAMAPRHAEVFIHGKQVRVRDLGSQTGTRLNGVSLSDEHPLAEGDVLRLGDTILVFSNRGRAPVSRVDPALTEPQLTGATPSIEAVRRSVEAVAAHPRMVVITGETGTGKEIVARLIHRRSGRQGPFVAVNCGGFTESLLASELFGHVRGAFTGAVAEQQGLFRAAHGGTLFLDEAGDIPAALQATLLRVLETWQVRPVGSSRDVPVDVRVIAASNRELVTLVQQGRFRADLYARLAQWVIRVPPLRERREDIPALSRALLSQLGAADRTLTPDLEEALLIHPWPLNVRGLANVLSIAAIATPAGSSLGLGPEVQSALEDNLIECNVAPPGVSSVEFDRAGLEELLVRFDGHVAKMARHVGVSRPRMYRKIWAAGLDPAAFRGRPAPGSPQPIEDDVTALRADAEAKLALKSPGPQASDAGSAALLHELQVHQIELEMQNDELRRDQLELQEAHERIVDLYDFAPVGYLTLDARGFITAANLTGATLLGVERKQLLGRRFAALLASADGDRWHLFFSGLTHRNSQDNLGDFAVERPDGTTFTAHLVCNLHATGKELGPEVRMVLTDVTESRRLEQALRETKARLPVARTDEG